MTTVASFPRSVERLDPVWIPLKDGTRLAARIWRPANAESVPVPAILEYIPYRRRDLTAQRDALTHPYVAGHGYACVRVDMRGSGDSDGVLTGEYLALEQDDAVEVIAWLAVQPWCTGAVGMMGHSWGGFNALQVAGRRRSGRSSRPAPRTTAMRTTSTTWAGACSRTTSAGRPPCSPTTPVNGRHRYDDIYLTVHTLTTDRYTIRPDDPLSARVKIAWTVRLARGDWSVETRTRTVLSASKDTFELEATLEALEADALVHEQRWERSIPRDLV